MTNPNTDDTTALARLRAGYQEYVAREKQAQSWEISKIYKEHAFRAGVPYIAALEARILELEAAVADANRQREAGEVALKQLENGNV